MSFIEQLEYDYSSTVFHHAAGATRTFIDEADDDFTSAFRLRLTLGRQADIERADIASDADRPARRLRA